MRSNSVKGEKAIGVVTWLITEAGITPLRGLLAVLYPLVTDLHVVTGGVVTPDIVKDMPGIQVHSVSKKLKNNALIRLLGWIPTQLRISWQLAKVIRHLDCCLFFLGTSWMPLPVLIAKLFRRRVILALAGSDSNDLELQFGFIISKAGSFLLNINCALADKIIIYSQKLIVDWRLARFQHKISIAHEHFINFDVFQIQKPLVERDDLIGYIGRLSREKGIMNFLDSIPLLKDIDSSFIIAGDGFLRDTVEEYLLHSAFADRVQYIGWLSHDDLSGHLNNLRLLVLPSYTEGLPNIVLEAMACGTPILATPVGVIPDIIRDGETGFIMENNSPNCIAKNIRRVLEHQDLREITRNARILVEREFTYEAAVETYRKILNDSNT